MSQKKSVRVCVAGLVFACALVGTSSMTTQADTVVATITVGSNPHGVAINPAGTFAYVTDRQGIVSKINLSTDTVTTIAVGGRGGGIAINPAGTFAYAARTGGGLAGESVSKINLATDTVVATIAVSSEAWDVAINPAGTFAYVTSGEMTTVSKINLATDTVVATITVGTYPVRVAINPAGTFAYVTNFNSTTVSRINLVNDTVVATITVGSSPNGVAIDPAGTFAYVTNAGSNTVSKIALAATDPQSINFMPVVSQLSGAQTVALSATASSSLAVAFTSATPAVCTVSGSTVTMVTVGDCTINANQAGGSGWDAAPQVSNTFAIRLSPPPGEPGVSIKNGDSYTNSKQVTLNLVWPEYATAVRISNDGGFVASKITTKDLAASIDWELDDSVKGVYTKVVYVRFNGVADTTKTYTDDIILDTTAPTIETSTATVVSSSIDFSLKATDDITGVNKVQIRNGAQTVTKDYATKVSVPLADLSLSVSPQSLSVSSNGVRKSAATSTEIRVSDNAGNWTGWQTVTVTGLTNTPAVTKPKVTTSKSATAKSIATYANLTVLSTSKVSLKVVAGYARYCKVSGTTLKGLKVGSCKVTVTVTPKKGAATFKTVTLKVTK